MTTAESTVYFSRKTPSTYLALRLLGALPSQFLHCLLIYFLSRELSTHPDMRKLEDYLQDTGPNVLITFESYWNNLFEI